MQPVIRSLSCPKVMAAMQDFVTLQRWEVLRRSDTPLSVGRLAALCGTTEAVAQRSLDLLFEAGFVKKLKVRSGERRVTYEAEKALVVEWSGDDPAHVEFAKRARNELRQVGRAIVDGGLIARTPGEPAPPSIESVGSPSLTTDEAEELVSMLRRTIALFADFERRVAARHALEMRKPESVREPAPQRIPYYFNVLLAAVEPTALPIPGISVCEKRPGRDSAREIYRNPTKSLSNREADIARRLARGHSRPAVAKALGLSINTVSSTTKRIYAKLGVHNRAEFTAHMASLPSA